MADRTKDQAMIALRELLGQDQRYFAATTGGSAGPGGLLTFQVGDKSYSGKAIGSISPGKVVAIKADDGSWFVGAENYGVPDRDNLLDYRHARPIDDEPEPRIPALIKVETAADITFHLGENGRSVLLTTIPKQLPGCPPIPPDPNAPPSPAFGYPGYFAYYFVASTASRANIFLDGVFEVPGYGAVDPLLFASFGGTTPAPFQGPGVTPKQYGYYAIQAQPPLGFLYLSSTGHYGAGGYDGPYSAFIAAKVAANERIDFSFYNAFELYRQLGSTPNPLTDDRLSTSGIEIVYTIVPGVSPTIPPSTPPAPPSGQRQDLLPNYYGAGLHRLDSLGGGNGSFNAYDLRTQPDPPNPGQPTTPGGSPVYPPRTNAYKASICADRRSNYVTIRDNASCPTTGNRNPEGDRLQCFKIRRGVVEIIGAPVVGDWRGTAIAIAPATLAETADPCIMENLENVTTNLFELRVTKLQSPSPPPFIPINISLPSKQDVERRSFERTAGNTCNLGGSRQAKARWKPIEIAGNASVLAIAPVIP
jgi:hypothetical protein